MPTQNDSPTPASVTLRPITDPPADALEALRAYHQGAVVAVANVLRPRFESGELHGWREVDTNAMENPDTAETYVPAPWAVAQECGRLFLRTSVRRAFAILLCSPSEPESRGDWTDPRKYAAEAMAFDVIRYARRQGWTTMEEGEISPCAIPAGAPERFAGYSGPRRHAKTPEAAAATPPTVAEVLATLANETSAIRTAAGRAYEAATLAVHLYRKEA